MIKPLSLRMLFNCAVDIIRLKRYVEKHKYYDMINEHASSTHGQKYFDVAMSEKCDC